MKSVLPTATIVPLFALICAVNQQACAEEVTGQLATIHAFPKSGDGPLLVQFKMKTLDPSRGVKSQEWDFGDDTKSSEPNPQHLYQRPGRYVVKFSGAAADTGAKETGTITVRVTRRRWNIVNRRDSFQRENAQGFRGAGLYAPGKPARADVTLLDAPNGVYDLLLRLDQRKRRAARFKVDRKEFEAKVAQDKEELFPEIKVKTVQILDGTVHFSIENLAESHLHVRGFQLRENSDLTTSIKVRPSAAEGAVPFKVRLQAANIAGGKYKKITWDFGDGNESILERGEKPGFSEKVGVLTPREHTYQAIGRYQVVVKAEDTKGLVHIGSTSVVALPPKTSELIGLKDFESFGFWGGNFFRGENVIEKLQAISVNVLIPGDPKRLSNSPELVAAYEKAGIRFSLGMQGPSWWYNMPEKSRSSWVFEPTKAMQILSHDTNKDGLFDLNGKVASVYTGHEISEYATHADRVRMYKLLKQHAPDIPVMVHFGGGLDNPFVRGEAKHPAGGMFKDYALGPGEADIVMFFISPPFTRDAEGNRIFDPRITLQALMRQKQYADRYAPRAKIWVGTTLGSGGLRGTGSKDRMWSPKHIDAWAKTILSVGGVHGIIARGFGRMNFDLRYGYFNKPEDGFIEQRKAFAEIGKLIRSHAL